MKTVPQYIYLPNGDGTFTIFSLVYRMNDRYEWRNYVAEVESESEAIATILKISGVT